MRTGYSSATSSSSISCVCAVKTPANLPKYPHIALGLLFCLLFIFLTHSKLHAQALYQLPATTFPVGTTPQGVAVADFTHTGYPGLVVTNSASNNMTLYPGSATGTFAAPVTIPTCTGPGQAIAADFDNDGYQDIALVCPAVGEVEVFLNNQSGGFGTGTTITVPANSVSLAAGDFNSDGYADLTVVSSDGSFTALLTSGASISTSQSATTTSGSGASLVAIATGYFDSSHHLDVAVLDKTDQVVGIITGDGAGNFVDASIISVQADAVGLAAGDWDQNGTTDLAVVNDTSGTISTFSGQGNDHFTSLGTLPLVQPSANTGAVSIASVDINGDGKPDLIADGITTNQIYLLLGNGNGTFQPVQQYSVSNGPAFLAVGDFNRDGKPDLAVTQKNGASVALLLNNTLPTPEPGGDSYAAPFQVPELNGNMADSITTADFNRDGVVDAAIAYLEDNAVRVQLTGNASTAPAYAVGSQPYDVVSGDLNGDGYADLVTANTGDDTVSVLLNHGASSPGTFATAVAYSVGHSPFQLAIGDLNGDGIPDLAVTNNGAGTVSILYGVAGGTFVAGPTLTVAAQAYGVAIGDFANNGKNDIAVTCYSTSQLYVFPNNGGGNFGSPSIYSTDSNPAELVLGDFNRDGKLDIVTGNTTANDDSFFAGNGDGTFQTGVISPSLNFPVSIAAGDVNGDGILDIVGVAPNFNEVVVTLGKGDGTFGTIAQRQTIAAGQEPWSVAVADVTNDGKLDIVTANAYNVVNLATVANQLRYETQYPPVSGGNLSANFMQNTSGTQITISHSPNQSTPIADDASVTLTATISSLLGGTTPTGTVIFEDNSGLVLGTAPSTLTSGTATLTLPNLGSGPHVFTALYSGDTNYQPYTSATDSGYLLTVAGTVVSLSADPSTVAVGSSFTYTVTVGTSGDGVDPAGTITLYGISSTGTVQAFDSAQSLVGNGDGTASVSHSVDPGVAAGDYEIYATYTPGTGSTYTTGSSPNVPLSVIVQLLETSTTLDCFTEYYFGFPTGNEVCYAQVTNSTIGTFQQGNVTFGVNGGTPFSESIQNIDDIYNTPIIVGYYASYSFPVMFGIPYSITATFIPMPNYPSDASSSASFSF